MFVFLANTPVAATHVEGCYFYSCFCLLAPLRGREWASSELCVGTWAYCWSLEKQFYCHSLKDSDNTHSDTHIHSILGVVKRKCWFVCCQEFEIRQGCSGASVLLGVRHCQNYVSEFLFLFYYIYCKTTRLFPYSLLYVVFKCYIVPVWGDISTFFQWLHIFQTFSRKSWCKV